MEQETKQPINKEQKIRTYLRIITEILDTVNEL